MAVTKKVATKATAAAVTNTDVFFWANPYGGSWTAVSNWFDNTTTATATATVTPGATNAVSIVGGAGSFTNITGNGAASRLAISNDVLLWGTVAVGGAITLFSPGTTVVSGTTLADLELDGGASLTAGGISGSGTVAVTGGSTLKTGSINMGGMLLATGGSTVQV
ncbi:MAG: hypothetical protein ACJ8AW_19605, partial [Rhodopila sp.]